MIWLWWWLWWYDYDDDYDDMIMMMIMMIWLWWWLWWYDYDDDYDDMIMMMLMMIIATVITTVTIFCYWPASNEPDHLSTSVITITSNTSSSLSGLLLITMALLNSTRGLILTAARQSWLTATWSPWRSLNVNQFSFDVGGVGVDSWGGDTGADVCADAVKK